MSLLFPDPPRDFRGRRALKILVRAVHVLAAGVFTGAHLLEVRFVEAGASLAEASDPAGSWRTLLIASGLAILALDLFESAAFLLQVRGLVVTIKIALLLCLPAFGGHAGALLAALVLASVVFSHAPSRVRYFLLVGRGRIRGASTKG